MSGKFLARCGLSLAVVAAAAGMIALIWKAPLAGSVVRGAQAQAAGNSSLLLVQLGVKGVTAEGGGASYANYLPKLDATGKLDFDMIPYLNPAAMLRLSGVYYVDAGNGADTAGNGAQACPYRTLQFAFADTAATATNPVFVLAAGVYTNYTSYVTSTRWAHITFAALNSRDTRVTGPLLLKMAADPVVDLYGVSMEQIQQAQTGQSTAVNLRDRAGLDSFLNTVPLTPGKTAAISYDPTAVAVPSGPTLTVRPLHEATALRYRPSVTGRVLWTNTEQTVSGALDEIAELRLLPKGASPGDMARWNGTNWVVVAAGSSNEVLFGGSSPGFRPPETTFLTNYYTIAQVGTISNGLWVTVTNWAKASFATPADVNVLLSAQRIAVTNWVDTYFYRSTEVDGLFSAYDAGMTAALADISARIAACYSKTGGVVTGNATFNGALAVGGAITRGGYRVPSLVPVPASSLALGNHGDTAYNVSNNVPFFYWYDANSGKWARAKGAFTW